ncbi:MAG: hypothetical protein AAF715_31345 [Myxococcota bacterium]
MVEPAAVDAAVAGPSAVVEITFERLHATWPQEGMQGWGAARW